MDVVRSNRTLVAPNGIACPHCHQVVSSLTRALIADPLTLQDFGSRVQCFDCIADLCSRGYVVEFEDA